MKQTKFLAMLFMAFAVAFSACTNVDDPDDPKDGDGAKLPFTETFETGMGKFTAQSVVGEQKWEHSSQYKYVLISGYINATTTNVANEDWLISPEISLAGVTSAKLTFEHASRYFGDINNEATVWVSENYKDGLPATATWTKITTPAFKDAGNWTMVSSGEISLKAFADKNIRIALKYVSTETKAGSWQLKNFKVEEGEATVIPEDEAKGAGTEASPYNIKAAMDNQGGLKWIEGYIVGNIDGEGKDMSKESKFVAPFTINTNVLMADKADETDVNKCFPVQLPAGVIRDGINLVTNGTVLGKKVKLYGSLETYFGKAGIKSPSYFAIDGGATGGTKPTDVTGAILAETFAANQGAFVIKDVTLPEGGTFVWKWDTFKFMKASAFIGSAKASEGWLISPSFSLAGKSAATLTFDHTGKFFTANKLTEQEVLFSTNYTDGMPSTATWTKLTIPTWPTGNDWVFVGSGNIALPAAALGQANVRIAFKYMSTTAGAATWEIKNLVVK